LKSTAVSLKEKFRAFVDGRDTLQVYREGNLVYCSDKDRVVPLLEYIDGLGSDDSRCIIFDKIMGNAAALLAVKAKAEEVFSPMGSQLGIDTLNRYGIKYHIRSIVPFIQKADSEDMCFMEKLSVGRSPDEFHVAIKAIIK